MIPPTIPNELPNDPELLKKLVQQLHEALHASQLRIDKLEHQLARLLRARYGPRAERVSPEQLLLFAQEVLGQSSENAAESNPQASPAEAAAEPPAPAPRRNGHGRRRLPKDLPRKQVIHDLPESEKPCPCCGQARTKIGEEVREELEYVPASLYVIEHVRPKYACPHCEGHVSIAEKPGQPIDKGLPGPGLLAYVITSKYADHLPLHRLERILRRHGVEISRSTMGGWVAACAGLLRPLYEQMKRGVLASGVIHTDDTPVPVQDKNQTKTRQGRLWVYVGDADHPYTVFDDTPTRSRDGPTAFLDGYAGYIQADAYGGYDHLFKPRTDGAPVPTEVGCWAHARRKFYEAQTSDPPRAHLALAMIRLLYDVEKEAKVRIERENLALDSPDAAVAAAARARAATIRYELRQEQAVPRLEQIKTWLDEQCAPGSTLLPRSPMGEAVGYCRSNWGALTRYVQDGRLNIDNNVAENALRAIVVGRKNWLFAGSDRGGQTAAILATVVVSCQRHHIDPFAYLRDVLTRIGDTPMGQLDPFLPDRRLAAASPSN